jgi:hypothetical protein
MAAFECLPDFFGSVPQLSFPDEMHNGKGIKCPVWRTQTIASS